MTKSEAIHILETTCLPIDKKLIPPSEANNMLKNYTEAIGIAIENLKTNISYKSKWVYILDSQMSYGYYHDGCKAKNMLLPNDPCGIYTHFRNRYRFCPDCGEPMFVEEE